MDRDTLRELHAHVWSLTDAIRDEYNAALEAGLGETNVTHQLTLAMHALAACEAELSRRIRFALTCEFCGAALREHEARPVRIAGIDRPEMCCVNEDACDARIRLKFR